MHMKAVSHWSRKSQIPRRLHGLELLETSLDMAELRFVKISLQCVCSAHVNIHVYGKRGWTCSIERTGRLRRAFRIMAEKQAGKIPRAVMSSMMNVIVL